MQDQTRAARERMYRNLRGIKEDNSIKRRAALFRKTVSLSVPYRPCIHTCNLLLSLFRNPFMIDKGIKQC